MKIAKKITVSITTIVITLIMSACGTQNSSTTGADSATSSSTAQSSQKTNAEPSTRSSDTVSEAGSSMDKSSETNPSADESSATESTEETVSEADSSMDESSETEPSADKSSATESTEEAVSEADSSMDESSETEHSADKSSATESTEEAVSEADSSMDESSETEPSADKSSATESTEEAVSEEEISVAPSSNVDTSWFDDAIFVGDSITNGLSMYAENGCLGDADFLCSVGLGFHNSLWDLYYEYAVHPTYNGETVKIEDGVKLSGKKKVFIMMGMNDLGYGIDSTIDAMKEVTDNILEKSPTVQIYIQTLTPLLSTIHRDDGLTNENIDIYNQKAKEVCRERGFIYVDVASVVKDASGCLIYDYCADPDYMGLHLSNKGCEAWVAYLKKHVQK